MLHLGVTEWVDEGGLPKERTQSEVAKALQCTGRGHTWRDHSLSSSHENLNAMKMPSRGDIVAHIRLRKPDKSEDKIEGLYADDGLFVTISRRPKLSAIEGLYADDGLFVTIPRRPKLSAIEGLYADDGLFVTIPRHPKLNAIECEEKLFQPRFVIPSGTARTGRYVSVYQRTAHYRAVPPGSDCFCPLPPEIDR
ncbi:hypothetical protein B296_00028667 [Ensete ventricosum]|uniref:Uncharacterized protein n=1 Tax=Ensete ventricosum TaxID=4639 RepID=A0A427AEU5_ENSVE|nr:hypothetical protein B296_00028667 [Ensete ventricosum]